MCSCPDSGRAASAAADAAHHAREPRRPRSYVHSASGSSTAIGPIRCPVLCATRYGASANARPPASAAARGTASSRSHAHAAPPARTYDRSTNAFHATTGPASAASADQGSPNSQPRKTDVGSAAGWNEYGSRHSRSSPRARLCPASQSW